MITKKEAIKKVRSSLDEDMDVIVDNIIEREYGWVLFPQSKEYIQSGDPMSAFIGSGGVLVEKTTGKTYEFGSAYSIEENLKIYELGYFQYEDWDIEITKVNRENEAIDRLAKLDIRYVVPEEEHGVVWKIPQIYTKKQLKTKLRILPVKFNLGNVYFVWEELESFKKQNAFEYQLSENVGYKNDI